LWPWLLRVRSLPATDVTMTLGATEGLRFGDIEAQLATTTSTESAVRFRRALEAARHGGYR